MTAFATGNKLLREGKLEEAIASYEKAIESNPQFAWSYQNLGEALEKAGRLEEAIAAFRQVVAINPQSPWSLYKLGIMLSQQGQFQEGVGYLSRALDLKKDVPEFYLGLGSGLVKLGQWSEAVECIDRVIQFSPDSQSPHPTPYSLLPAPYLTEAYFYLAEAKSGQGQWSEAVEFYRQSWEVNPGRVDCCIGWAKALGKLGRWSEAVELYRQGVVFSGESGEVLFGLGQALGQLGRWEEAVDEYRRAVGLGFEGAEVKHHLGYALGQLGRWEEAVVEYRLVVEINPRSAVVRHQLGYGLMRLSRWREAEVELRKAVELHPESAVVWQQLGDVLRELGEREEAVEVYQRAFNLTAEAETKNDSSSIKKRESEKREVTNSKISLVGTESQLSTYKNFLRPVNFSAKDLGVRLWGGYSRYILPVLEEITHDITASKRERSEAAWELVQWYYLEGNYERCLENIELIKIFQKKPEQKILLVEVQCLIQLNRIVLADERLNFAIKERGERADFLLLKGNTQRLICLAEGKESEASCLQLAYINQVYEKVGIAPLKLKDASLPLHISNITASAKAKITEQNIKVSVIMPAYNAEKTIHIALESLLAQTWKNIEIIVVDDCSNDNTCGVVTEYIKQDDRIKLITKEINEGAYPTRNRGLEVATGELITVHDSDDWSHPQKIEYHIDAMKSKNSCIAVMSYWLRVDENLMVVGIWKPGPNLFEANLSSLMFKREILDKLGSWDSVKISGDSEFRYRLIKLYGSNAIYNIPKEMVLSFGLLRPDSLTRAKATHVKTLDFGLRRHYRDAYEYWHSQPEFKLSPKLSQVGRQFPLPLGNQIKKLEVQFYDLIVISDFALKGGAFVSTLNYIVAACRLGMKVAVVHWRKYELKPQKLNYCFYDVCVKYGVDILTPGDRVDANFVLFGYPAIIQYKPDAFPYINTTKLIVIINQFTARLVDGSDSQYDPDIVRANLKSMFGQEGFWIPISSWVKRLMSEDKRYPNPYSNPWYPMIDVEQWCRQTLRWRGQERKIPVVGRHGRDAYSKWPEELTALKKSYGVNLPWEVRLLGGAEIPIDLIGEQPQNWQVIPFDSISVQEFLEDLDFFIHYPHENYIEEFGQAIIEAMAVGIPVILPYKFKETFGDAALYANPEDVNSRVQQLWLNESKYLECAKIGREFVKQNCDLMKFVDRLNSLDGNEKVGQLAVN
ncbi:tetratricopeptide repeat protein [Dapis sp. BLCC M229]|uniref:tetratricopeptide repeat protein n=1 Tax=Dapis sp. BLCC M229 TaxID=3400188 RepID=UPI003CEE2D37